MVQATDCGLRRNDGIKPVMTELLPLHKVKGCPLFKVAGFGAAPQGFIIKKGGENV